MRKVPIHNKRIRRKDASDSDGQVRKSIGRTGCKHPPQHNAKSQDDCALHHEDLRDVGASVAHRSEDRDLPRLIDDNHDEGVEHPEARDQNDR